MKIAGSKLLLVEDEPIIGFALEDMMNGEGAETILASTLEMAMEAARSHEFDGAIVDVNLHGKDSYAVARELLARKVTVVFATGYGDAVHPPEFVSVSTIAKPYNLESITAALTAAA